MTLFPFYRYHFFNDPFDRFFQNRVDFFDSWYDFDTFPSFDPILPRLRSIKERQQLSYSSNNVSNSNKSLALTSQASQSDKFHIQVNVNGFNPDEIRKRVEGRKLIIEAKHEERRGNHDYTSQELRKSYELPEYVDSNRLTSYVTPDNMLVIEIPIQNSVTERQLQHARDNNNQSLTQFGQHHDGVFDYAGPLSDSNLQSHIVDKGNNQKQLEMTVEMKNYQPQGIKVSVKNNELIVQGEYHHKDKNRSERSYFFKSTTLPPGTQVDQLESHLNDDGQLKITAPYV